MTYGQKVNCTCAICSKTWTCTKSQVRETCGERACADALRGQRQREKNIPDIRSKACVVCGTMFDYDNKRAAGRKKQTCSKSCQSKTDRPYISGDDHHMKTQASKDKVRETTLKNFGAIGYQVKELNDRARATMIERYGTEHALQVPEFIEKCKNTWSTPKT